MCVHWWAVSVTSHSVTAAHYVAFVPISSQVNSKELKRPDHGLSSDSAAFYFFQPGGALGGFLSGAGGTAGAVLEAGVSVSVILLAAQKFTGFSPPRLPEGDSSLKQVP